MARHTSFVGAGLLVSLLAGHPSSVLAQTDPLLTRLVSSDPKKFQGELDRAVADGYRLVGGDASIDVAIFERADDGVRRSYLFADNVDKFLKAQKLPPGYRLVPSTFGGDLAWFGAIFEHVDGDDRQRAYRFVKAGSTGGIRKKLVDEGAARGALVLAVAGGGDGVAVILEDSTGVSELAVIASGTGSLGREISSAASKGLCIVDSDGIRGAVFVLQGCASGQSAPVYHAIATTKTDTFENELNAAAAKGQRFVPASLIGVEKKLLMTPVSSEIVGLMETTAAAGPQPSYRVLATVRLGTLAKELEDSAKAGFRLVAFTIGPNESLMVLEKR